MAQSASTEGTAHCSAPDRLRAPRVRLVRAIWDIVKKIQPAIRPATGQSGRRACCLDCGQSSQCPKGAGVVVQPCHTICMQLMYNRYRRSGMSTGEPVAICFISSVHHHVHWMHGKSHQKLCHSSSRSTQYLHESNRPCSTMMLRCNGQGTILAATLIEHTLSHGKITCGYLLSIYSQRHLLL